MAFKNFQETFNKIQMKGILSLKATLQKNIGQAVCSLH